MPGPPITGRFLVCVMKVPLDLSWRPEYQSLPLGKGLNAGSGPSRAFPFGSRFTKEAAHDLSNL